MNWLDTETEAILRKSNEPPGTPVKAAEFGLVLLRRGNDTQRLIRALRRINDCGESEAIALLGSSVPVTVNSGLTEAEALYGQFELVCCDAVAAFVRSEVLLAPDQKDYLDGLFKRVLDSPEFSPTRIEVIEVPATEGGERFMDQFLGDLPQRNGYPIDEFSLWVTRKKARMMRHWAARIGAHVESEELRKSEDDVDAP